MPPSITVNKVSKRYRIGRASPRARGLLDWVHTARRAQYHWAIKELSFELEPGQALGIIGPNGAGKTTILKILSHVTLPTSGTIALQGRLSALIELGAGFHPDLTGRENIYLNGTILGMRRAEIKARFDQIVEFAGIGNFLDTPVKRYSSGMYARLGFAIAAHVDPQILLVDEVLAVGDYPFQMKCYARMDELRARGTSLIFVSHNLEAVRRVCDRGLVMYRGEPIFQGTAAEAVVAYSDKIRQAARAASAAVPTEGGLAQRIMTFDAEIQHVELVGPEGQPTTVLQSGQRARVCVDVYFHRDVHAPVFACTIRTADGALVYDTTTRWMNLSTPDFHAGEQWCIVYDIVLPLLTGAYQVGTDVAASDLSHYYDRVERALEFTVFSSDGAQGLVDLGGQISFQKINAAGEALAYVTSQHHHPGL